MPSCWPVSSRCGLVGRLGVWLENTVGRQRLPAEHVERGAAEVLRAQCVRKRRLVDHAAARGIDQHRTGLHRGQAPHVVARSNVMVAAKQGKAIPLGWVLDEAGQLTTDAQAALRGSMMPAGGVKGAMLALMVELLVTSLAGALFGAEADSFFDDASSHPRID